MTDPDEQGVSWTILDDHVTMDVVPQDRGDVRVRFRDADDEVLWSSTYENGFWRSRTKKGEIGNHLANNTTFSKAKVKEELEDVWTDLTENERDYRTRLLSPSVEDLITNTESVEVHGGEETEYHVYVKAIPLGDSEAAEIADGGAEVRRLTFSNPEWVKADGETQTPPVVEKYANEFFQTLDITWSEWREEIRPSWQEQQTIVTDERMSTADRIAMSVVRSLRHRLDVHADRSKMINDAWNGWYDPEAPDGEAVVWVDGTTLDEALDQHDKGTDYRSALSRALQKEAYTVGNRRQTTIEGDPVELYPFLPETLGIEEIDVIGLDDDGDDDDAAASDDDGDDGDDGEQPDELVDDVVGVVDDLDPAGEGVEETAVVAEASATRDLGPPGEVEDAIERAVLDGLLYRPDDELVAVRPGGGEAPGEDEIDTDEDGVPEP